MANVRGISAVGLYTITVTEDETLNLGEAAEGCVGSWALQISGGGTYSIVIRKKLRGSTVADGSAPTAYYENAATGSVVAAGTALTAAALVKVPADGCAVILSIDWTAGACVIEAVPLLG